MRIPSGYQNVKASLESDASIKTLQKNIERLLKFSKDPAFKQKLETIQKGLKESASVVSIQADPYAGLNSSAPVQIDKNSGFTILDLNHDGAIGINGDLEKLTPEFVRNHAVAGHEDEFEKAFRQVYWSTEYSANEGPDQRLSALFIENLKKDNGIKAFNDCFKALNISKKGHNASEVEVIKRALIKTVKEELRHLPEGSVKNKNSEQWKKTNAVLDALVTLEKTYPSDKQAPNTKEAILNKMLATSQSFTDSTSVFSKSEMTPGLLELVAEVDFKKYKASPEKMSFEEGPFAYFSFLASSGYPASNKALEILYKESNEVYAKFSKLLQSKNTKQDTKAYILTDIAHLKIHLQVSISKEQDLDKALVSKIKSLIENLSTLQQFASNSSNPFRGPGGATAPELKRPGI